jgi:hypothetical protein
MLLGRLDDDLSRKSQKNAAAQPSVHGEGALHHLVVVIQ